MANEVITKDDALVKMFFERMDETLKRFSRLLENRKPTLNPHCSTIINRS
jgi:hypothetical protein